MRKKIFQTVVFAMLILSVIVFSTQARGAVAGNGTLKVVVDGCPGDQGLIRIALVNSPEGYKDSSRAFMTKAVPVQNGKALYEFRDVPFGEYAVTVYHDANGNNRLDKSVFGKPVEAYGFSNNARSIVGKPDYKKATFVLNRAEMTVTVSVE